MEDKKPMTEEQIEEIDLKTENENDLFSASDSLFSDVSMVTTENDEKMPVSYEYAEEALLSMFIQNSDVAEYVVKSGLTAAHFSKYKNKSIYQVVLDMRLERLSCNFDFVVDKLEEKTVQDGRSVLVSIGGLPELNKIIDSAPAIIDINVAQGYIDIISNQSKLLKVQDAIRVVSAQRKYNEQSVVKIVADVQQIINDDTMNREGLVGMDITIPDAYLRYMDRRNNPEKYKGFNTGFYWLNKHRAISKKRVTVIGAGTSCGKSVLVSNIITRAILDEARVLLFTPELDTEEYIDRLMCAESRISMERWKDGTITDAENERYGKIQDMLLKISHNLYIEDRGTQSCSFILTSIKKHLLNNDVDIVVVDYLQNLDYDPRETTKRAITNIMQRFCAFAKDNDIAFIVLSQLRRIMDREPEKEDLKESGDIENMADCIVMLHRISITKPSERNKGWYKIAKNRQGPTTDNVTLAFSEEYLKFSETDHPVDGIVGGETLVGGYDDNIPDEDRPTEQSVMKEIINKQGVV